jgi:hypothetical protein
MHYFGLAVVNNWRIGANAFAGLLTVE